MDTLIDCIAFGRAPVRVTLERSRLAVQRACEELRQIEARITASPTVVTPTVAVPGVAA